MPFDLTAAARPDSVRRVPNHGRKRVTAEHEGVEWLTPAPDGTPVTLRWPDEKGPFLLTCHLARVEGRTMLVGLDIRSFEPDDEAGSAGGRHQGLAEVNHPVLRSLRAGEIAEAARARLAAILAQQAGSDRWDDAIREAAARTFQVLTAPDRSRPSGYRPASEQLQRVAQLYLEAIAAGGDSARRPSIYVHHALAEAGFDVSLNTVRGQIARARAKGLIPPSRN
jgi:hypothetical protein